MTGTQGIPMPRAIVVFLAFNDQGHPGEESPLEAFSKQRVGPQLSTPFAWTPRVIHLHKESAMLRVSLFK